MDLVKERSEVNTNDRWNLNSLYENSNQWKNEFKKTQNDGIFFSLTKLLSLNGNLHKGVKEVKEALNLYFSLMRKVEKLYVWAHLRHDEEITNDEHKSYYGQALNLYYTTIEKISWIKPELLTLEQEKLQALCKDKELEEYSFFLEDLLRRKPHTLSIKEEELIAQSSQALNTAGKAFRAMNDADFIFPDVVDKKGNTHPLTHGTYQKHLTNNDRTLRKNAFTTMLTHYKQFQNTLCETLQGNVNTHYFQAKTHNFKSCLKSALFENNIDTNIYNTLITTVNSELSLLQRYSKVKKKLLNLKELHLYDLYVPLGKRPEKNYSFEEAVELIVDSVAPLGEEYQKELEKGLKNKRWVDRYENKNKRSGAYSSGCFDSEPYILMNYKGELRDVFTLAHEAGHSMHSLLSHRHQPYQYGDYSIFLAEIASTFNEDLLRRQMLERCDNKEEKIYLLGQTLEDIRATLFRQTLFAEFELFIHEEVEKQQPLTPNSLNNKYLELCRTYYAPEVSIDSIAEIEWSRIPHFYSNFYVYQYATGISAALALSKKVLEEGIPMRDKYLNFLKSGESIYPLPLLEQTGLNMNSSEPITLAMRSFESYLTQLENLI